MRPEVQNPADQHKLQQLLPLIQAIFHLHESGQQYASELIEISRLLTRFVSQIDVLGAFGSISASEFAKRLAIDWHTIPGDLTDSELLELLDATCEARGDQVTVEYWVRCLRLNTGDEKISDLIFWPEEYLGGEYDGRDLTSAEMLQIVIRKQKKENT
jgi:hypothetical protein